MTEKPTNIIKFLDFKKKRDIKEENEKRKKILKVLLEKASKLNW